MKFLKTALLAFCLIFSLNALGNTPETEPKKETETTKPCECESETYIEIEDSGSSLSFYIWTVDDDCNVVEYRFTLPKLSVMKK